VARQFPAIGAPYKTSVHVLWVAPFLNVLLFLAFAGVLSAILFAVRRVKRRSPAADDQRARSDNPESDVLIAVAVFTFLGVYGVISAPRLLHPASAAILAAGVGIAAFRGGRGHYALATKLRKFVMAIPVLLGSLVLGTTAALRGDEVFRGERSPAQGSFNVLLVVLDTVRRDHFWWAGGTAVTPNIDAFTSRGVRFDDAWSVSSWSLPAQASILTGAYPHEHGADWPSLALRDSTLTLGEYFSRRGYDTGAFSSNSSWITPEYLGRGFDRFDVYSLEDHVRRTAYGRLLSAASRFVGLHYAGRGRPASDVSADLLDFVGERRDRPFFAYVCYMDVNRAFHNRQLNHPFWEKKASVREVVSAYEKGLRQLDADFGDLIATFERRRMLENTIVVITSDHGESFGARHAADRDPAGHGTSLFPEQTRVPLFVVLPSPIRNQRIVSRTVSVRAIPATVAFLAGDSTRQFDGFPLITNDGDNTSAGGDTAALATLLYDKRNSVAFATGGWEYIRDGGGARIAEHLIRVPLRPGDTDLSGQPSVSSMRAGIAELLAGNVTPPQAGSR